MELHELPADYIEVLINLAFVIVATIGFGAVTALAGAGAWGSGKRVLRWSRAYVDQPSDFAMVIAGQVFHIPPEKASLIATRLFDELMKQGEPLGEPTQEMTLAVTGEVPDWLSEAGSALSGDAVR